MSTKPDVLDVLNSQILDDDRAKYLQTQSQLNATWTFEIVPNYFKQSLAETDETKFNYFDEHFGIIDSWERAFADLRSLNEKSDDNTVYKIFLLGRHGQGYHNMANLKYGEKAWNEHWLHLTGDGEIVWAPDPELTELGQAQAKDNNYQLKVELNRNLRIPTKWYSSPFRRSVDTLIGSWQDIVDLKEVKPLIKEDFRETIGVHLCDKRSTRSVISEKYGPLGFVIEDGFEEKDVYYKDDYREKVWEQALRQNRGFQDIFNSTDKKGDAFISITSHSGSIRTQLMVLNHRPFAIGTGGMIPVFVKATKRQL
ncbi:hypothetical protein PUMCH_002045 [Australozyma saopauloensis]|uniref:Phosphoglycerate mutase n=1 Tax=Australozyma saopauloensis TaxID=291208 RepID=A0AAX4H881_9ASCO|nr:hypothetical protein PUMCH_002045 [[Candida] saopauloensis]